MLTAHQSIIVKPHWPRTFLFTDSYGITPKTEATQIQQPFGGESMPSVRIAIESNCLKGAHFECAQAGVRSLDPKFGVGPC